MVLLVEDAWQDPSFSTAEAFEFLQSDEVRQIQGLGLLCDPLGRNLYVGSSSPALPLSGEDLS